MVNAVLVQTTYIFVVRNAALEDLRCPNDRRDFGSALSACLRISKFSSNPGSKAHLAAMSKRALVNWYLLIFWVSINVHRIPSPAPHQKAVRSSLVVHLRHFPFYFRGHWQFHWHYHRRRAAEVAVSIL